MSTLTGQDLVQSYDMIDAPQNLDSCASVSGIVKNCAVNLSKMSNDLRLMSSGPRTGLGEINLPADGGKQYRHHYGNLTVRRL